MTFCFLKFWGKETKHDHQKKIYISKSRSSRKRVTLESHNFALWSIVRAAITLAVIGLLLSWQLKQMPPSSALIPIVINGQLATSLLKEKQNFAKRKNEYESVSATANSTSHGKRCTCWKKLNQKWKYLKFWFAISFLFASKQSLEWVTLS